MLEEKKFSLAVPEGPPERLSLLCDFRGRGFPAGGTKSGTIWLPGTGIGRPPRAKPVPPPYRRRKYKNPPSRRPGRPGTPVPKPKLSPAEAKKALGKMQWTYLGRALLDNPGDVFTPGANVPAGHTFPGEIGRWDDTCGGHISGRWNAVSYFASSQSAFEFLRCADQPGNGAGWGSNGAEANFTIKIPANHNAVIFGPRTDFADWWATGRHGRWINRAIAGSGELTIPYTPGYTKPLGMPEVAPRLSPQLETGFLPWRAVKAAAKADPHSDRGYAPPGRTATSPATGLPGRRPDRPTPGLPKPPPPRTRQAKYVSNSLPTGEMFRWARNLLNASSEWKDWWDVLYGALDKETQISTDCKGVACQIAAVTQNLDKLDFEKAAKGLLQNEVGDFLQGRAHRMAKQGARSPGLGTGVGGAAPRVPF